MLYLQPEFARSFSSDERQFVRLFNLDGEVYRQVNGRKTLRFHHHGKSYFLKAHAGVGWTEIVKNLVQFRLPVVSANTEWRALHRLKALGIETLTPLAYGCEGRNPARLRSFLITEDLGETITLEDLLSAWNRMIAMPPGAVRLKRTLLEQVATITRTLHENGVNHRDLYLCHLRVPIGAITALTLENVRVYVMDLHRAQLRSRTPERWAVKDLGGLYFSAMDLGLNQRDLLRFMRTYSRQSVGEILTGQSRFWKKVRGRAVKLYERHRG